MAITLLQSFQHEHPEYTDAESMKHRNAKKKKRASFSSRGTEEQDPPRILIERDVGDYVELADKFLNSPEASASEIFTENFCPTKEPAILMTEQDVVALSRLYITHPTIVAIEAKHPDQLKPRSEYVTNGMRVDLSFKHQSQGPSEAVMMIEFKGCGYLQQQQFRDAMFPTEEGGENRLKTTGWFTTLEAGSNAWNFTKQVTAYAERANCKYVALCDYEELILFVFDDRLETAHCTIVPRPLFRKALYRFIEEALINK